MNVYVTPNPGQLGQFVSGGKRAGRPSRRRPRQAVARKGSNRIRLVVVDRGIAIDDVIAPKVVWAK